MNLGHETETAEFKKSTSELKEGISSIAAILNKHGRGELYFGVKDNGDVCGMQVSDKTLREIGQAIDQSIEPRIHPTIEELNDNEGHRYVRISFEGTDAPYACRGIFRSRVSDSDVVMSTAEVRRMAANAEDKTRPWDSRPSSRPLSDVDEATLRAYIERGQSASRITFDYTGPADALERLGLLSAGAMTNAADILFCVSKYPMLKMGIFADHSRVDMLDIQQEQGTLFYLSRRAEFYILSNIRRRVEFDGGMERREIPEIPMEAVREVLINAFTHRSYRSDMAVQVEIYPDSVEIFSPGWFPEGHTPEAHLSGKDRSSISPNPLIASALFKSKDIESFATGMPRVKRLCDQAEIALRYERTLHGTNVVFERRDPFGPAGLSERAASDSDGFRQIPANSSKFQQIPANPCTPKQALKELSANEHAVYEYLKDNPRSSAALVSNVTGIQRRTLSNILKRLQERSLVIAAGSNRSLTYSIKDTDAEGGQET